MKTYPKSQPVLLTLFFSFILSGCIAPYAPPPSTAPSQILEAPKNKDVVPYIQVLKGDADPMILSLATDNTLLTRGFVIGREQYINKGEDAVKIAISLPRQNASFTWVFHQTGAGPEHYWSSQFPVVISQIEAKFKTSGIKEFLDLDIGSFDLPAGETVLLIWSVKAISGTPLCAVKLGSFSINELRHDLVSSSLSGVFERKVELANGEVLLDETFQSTLTVATQALGPLERFSCQGLLRSQSTDDFYLH